MKALALVFAMAALLLSAGCDYLLSIPPLATAETSVFDAELTGDWSCQCWVDRSFFGPVRHEVRGLARVRAGSGHPKDYDIVWLPDEREALRLKGQLVKVRDRLVFDLIPASDALSETAELMSLPGLTVPAHWFLLVEKTADGVTLHSLDSQWLLSQVTSADGLPHVMTGHEMVITAGSEEIHAFLLRFGLDPQAVSDHFPFKRVRQQEANDMRTDQSALEQLWKIGKEVK